MHVEIEKARKAAGISGMKKNYPDDPKQRGCGYWAAYTGSCSNSFASKDAELMRMKDEILAANKRNVELEHALNEALKGRVQLGVEAIGHQEGWSVDRRNETVKRIAG